MTALDAVESARALSARDHAPRAEIEALQQRRLAALLAHARAHSPYYRERLPAGADLAELPTLDKAALMEHFDAIVCDPRLRRDALLEHLAAPPSLEPHLGEYRVASTSGSSGLRGVFVYDRAGWTAYVAQFLRITALAGMPLWEQRKPRVGIVAGSDPRHAGAQVAMTCAALGLLEPRPLPVTLPLARIVDGLNDYQPDYLHAYGSYAALLADEQLGGRLRISPSLVTTSSELLTAEAAARVEAAFGVQPFDFYATTEGLWGGQCREHDGFHLCEEYAIVENVDADGRPVPDGEPGARVLLTNLANRVQPLIRYELTDTLTIDQEPCPCGRTLARVGAIHGRADDVQELQGVTVHSLQFCDLAADPRVREFQVVQRAERLTVRVVSDDPDATRRVHDRLAARLRALGVDELIDVERCAALERPPSGKLQMVVAL